MRAIRLRELRHIREVFHRHFRVSVRFRTHRYDVSPASSDPVNSPPAAIRMAVGGGIEPPSSWVRARRYYQQQLPRNITAVVFVLVLVLVVVLESVPEYEDDDENEDDGRTTQRTVVSSGRGSRTPIAWFKAKQRTVGPSPRSERGSRLNDLP